MAERIRTFDWASTPVGPIEEWEDTLLTTVNLMLASRHPMFLFWGPELIQFYNDGYRATLDDLQHPLALGNQGEVYWANIWHIIGPQVAAVMRGESIFVEDLLIPGRRSGPNNDTYWSYSYTSVRDTSGAIRGVFVVCTETTGAMLAREVLQKEKQRLAELFRQAPAFFAVLGGPQHVFEMVNPSYQELVGPRPIVGLPVAEAVPEAVRQGFLEILDRVRATGQPYVGRAIPIELNRGRANQPEMRYLNFIYQPMRDMEGATSGILVFGVDVTEGHRAQKLLIQTEKLAAVGQMASMIAHEINNPLEAVTNLLYLARRTDDPAGQAGYLELADKELRRISAISSQTLRFHRQLTSPTEVRCDQLFSSSLMIYERRIQNLSIEIRKRKRATQSILCYEGEIRQVLNNLISNALDAVTEHGRLWVRSADAVDPRTGTRGVRLTVADDGTGISPEALGRIFEPFFTTKGTMGTGLGLWVSHEIVARHGGRLRVRSARLPHRHGSVFTLFLPLNAVPRPAVDQAGAVTGPITGGA
jgi:signal transduction histidine kinase